MTIAKRILSGMLLFGVLMTVPPVFAYTDQQKDIDKHQKNIVNEQHQVQLRKLAQKKLWQSRAEERNVFVRGKNRTIAGYHNQRLEHQTKRGAKLVKRINERGQYL